LVPEVIQFSKDIGMKMMRYPGGCITHGFDWKEAVGPVKDRPNYSFGLDEFLLYCRTVGAEPLISVSDYTGTPQDAADLVEYLNAPADARHPWAQKRARWGHPQPYHVRFFEMGNESDHGNHARTGNAPVAPKKIYTAQEYADWVLTCAKLMRAVDPTIQIGALMGTGTPVNDPWNYTVLSAVQGDVDFIVAHMYTIGCGVDDALRIPGDQLMQGCMASVDQAEVTIHQYNQLIRQCTGRNIPLAITEYNAGFVQEKPVPYRFTYGAALCNADLVRVLLQPQSNVLMANYWHFINGYWGMVQGPVHVATEPHLWKHMPAYYLYRLWGQHFGTQLVFADVKSSPTIELSQRVLRIYPTKGTRIIPPSIQGPENLLANIKCATPAVPGGQHHGET
ncbi:MAG TPA: hypothetical protein VHV83_06990, partial [Armatimonadota bacterium]|nr:hypothetical protein [Armatimonadota bacterium]